MPLSSNNLFGVQALTESINKLPTTPTIIRSLNLFKPEFKTTTYVQIEEKEGALSLVSSAPRGGAGEPVKQSRTPPRTFSMIHLPKDDIVRADDVQNLRAFGQTSQAMAVSELVNDKLAQMKADIEYTREHLMLGALMGKILDADGTNVLADIYKEFGLTRKVHTWTLTDKSNISQLIDAVKLEHAKLRKGEAVSGFIVLASAEFMEKLIYHKSVYDLYARYQDGSVYREGDTEVGFKHKGIDFITYADEFGSGLKINAGEAILLPKGTRSVFKEYFAPADMNSTVNTLAKAYYASREPLEFDKGYKLHAQSNPLPLVLRPDLVQTLKIA